MPCKRPAWVLGIAAFAWWLGAAQGGESPDARRERLAQMSAADRDELLRKKERFEKLPLEEQDRLRRFHEQVSSDPAADKLQAVMSRYCAWLKTLTSEQRGALESLPIEERIPKVREFMKLQEEQNFKRLVSTPLPANDLAYIFGWIEDYTMRNEEWLLTLLPRDAQRWVLAENDPVLRRGRLGLSLSRQGSWRFADALADEEEFKRFVAGLNSAEAKKALEAAREPEKKQVLVREWLRAAVMARMTPPVTDEELERFYVEDLDAARREQLEQLPREEMQKELRRLYNWYKIRREPQPGGGPPRPPRGSGGRPPGSPPLSSPPAGSPAPAS